MDMIRLPQDFREFLRLLNSHEVRYLLIGGFAVGYHGYPRATGDMGIWIAATPANAEKMLNVLKAFGFDECYDQRVTDLIDGVRVDIISLEHLKKNKKASGRTKDLYDFECLP